MSFDASGFLGGLFHNDTSSPPPEEKEHVPQDQAQTDTHAEPQPDYSTPRSRLLLSDPVAFFAGWRRIGPTWLAPWHQESRN